MSSLVASVAMGPREELRDGRARPPHSPSPSAEAHGTGRNPGGNEIRRKLDPLVENPTRSSRARRCTPAPSGTVARLRRVSGCIAESLRPPVMVLEGWIGLASARTSVRQHFGSQRVVYDSCRASHASATIGPRIAAQPRCSTRRTSLRPQFPTCSTVSPGVGDPYGCRLASHRCFNASVSS